MKSIVSIEIGRESIKAAEISNPESKNPKVAKIGEIELPPGVAGESQVYEKDRFTKALQELWQQEKFSTKRVALAVSGRRFMARELETAHTSLKDFYNVMSYEVSSVIPDQMKEPVIDFYPMYHKKEADGIKTVGLVIATPSEPIEEIINCINNAKLELMFVDFAPMAIARFLKNNVQNESQSAGYALANIREYSTDILVAKDNIPRIIRVAGAGLTPPTKKRGRHMKEEQLNSSGLDGAERSPIETLAREIRITVSAPADDLEVDIDTLYVTGSRTDSETMKALSDLTNMKVVPLSVDMVNHKGGLDEELTSSDFVAVCAGMRGKK